MQSKSFTKLFASITDSSIWGEDDATRIVWITMLAMADAHGYVGASIPGLAARARKSIPEVESALAKFKAPDPYSRTREHEGRRVADADGGWLLLNYEKHRGVTRIEAVRQSKREWARKSRSAVLHVEQSRHVEQTPSASTSASTSGSDPDPEGGAGGNPPGVFAAPTITVDPKRGNVAPDDFEPTATHRVRCAELKLDVDTLLREFKLFEFNRPYSDWGRRFSRWIEDAKLRGEVERVKAHSGAGKGSAGSFGRSPLNPLGWAPNERHEALIRRLNLTGADLQRLAAAYVRAEAVVGRTIKDADIDFAKRLCNYSRGKPFGFGVTAAAVAGAA